MIETQYLAYGELTFRVMRSIASTSISRVVDETSFESLFSAPTYFDNGLCMEIVRSYLTGRDHGLVEGANRCKADIRERLGL